MAKRSTTKVGKKLPEWGGVKLAGGMKRGVERYRSGESTIEKEYESN